MPSVSLISAVPRFVTKEENISLSAATPSSFSDLPPILVHKEENVSVTLDPPVSGFAEGDAAKGTLYVISSVLVFMSANNRGFQIEYPSITLHAISRAEGQPSIYCQLDEETDAAAEQLAHANLNGTEAEDEGDEEDKDEDLPMRELSIIPENPQALEAIFEALSQCASLHPDIDDEDGDDDAFVDPDSANFEIFDGDEDQELSEAGRAALDHLESIIDNPFEPKDGQGGAEIEESLTQSQQASQEELKR